MLEVSGGEIQITIVTLRNGCDLKMKILWDRNYRKNAGGGVENLTPNNTEMPAPGSKLPYDPNGRGENWWQVKLLFYQTPKTPFDRTVIKQ